MNAESSEQPKHHPTRFCINNPRNLEERKFLFDQSFECRDCLSNCTRCFETRFLEINDTFVEGDSYTQILNTPPNPNDSN